MLLKRGLNPDMESLQIPGEFDPWSLEDERTSREVTTLDTFSFYALAPSTSEVVYYLPKDLPPEMEASGPNGRRVWVSLPQKFDPVFWVNLNRLAHQLARKGIFKPG